MAAESICKWNKYSHCRYGRFCYFKHVNKRCQEKECDARQCNLRHPRPCRNVLQGKSCPFGETCSFEHKIEGCSREETRDTLETIETLKKKVEGLENLIKSKDSEICDLMQTIDAFNYVVNVSESDEDSEHSVETNPEDSEEMITLNCDECNFRTTKKTGLKIHKSKVHVSIQCDKCYSKFRCKDKLDRHIACENTLENICDKEEESLVLKEIAIDEKCIGIFSVDNPRDDALPDIFLHTDQCWESSGHCCPSLPNHRRCPPIDFDPLDDDYYDPTLHTTISRFVVGDLTERGCYPDWAKVKQNLQKYTTQGWIESRSRIL